MMMGVSNRVGARSFEADGAATLRDQFAMAALTGMCAHPDWVGTYHEIAMQVYRIADPMLKARQERKA